MALTIPHGKPVIAEKIHLTLRFIGEQDESFIKLLPQVLNKTRVTLFSLKISGTGRFPIISRKPARIAYAAVSPVDELLRLQRQIDVAVEQLGVPEDKWPFKPHVTLARVKKTPFASLAKFLEQTKNFCTKEWLVNSFQLLETKPGPKHRHYRQTFELFER